MIKEPLAILPDFYPEPLKVLGTDIRILSSSIYQTIIHQSGLPGMGLPLHRHDWDEALYVVKGSVNFLYNGEYKICTPGAMVHTPANSIHGFVFGEGGGEVLEMSGKGSQAAEMYTALAKVLPTGLVDASVLIKLLGQHGVQIQSGE